MNVLLTTSAAPLMSPFSTNEKRPPLGIGYLISVLRKAGHNVFFIDNYLRPSDFLESGYLLDNEIDLVGIYADTICYRDTRRMLHKLQQMREQKIWWGKIAVGGPHTSADIESIPDFVDHIVVSEGERAILDIVEGTTDRTIRKEPIHDLDELPMPAYDYFVDLPYDFSVQWLSEQPVFTMNTSRGCPFQCAFCSVGSVWGHRYRYFSAGRVIEEVRYLADRYEAQGIYFREDNFTVNRQRVIDFCQGLHKANLDVRWMCETRIDTLDHDLLKLMHQAGCRALYIGVESGVQRLLDFMNKGITIEQTEAVFRWCNELGINTYASFIAGVPTETSQEREQSIEFSQKIKATTCGFNVFVGIPRSPLYDHVLEHSLDEYIDDRGLVYLQGHDQLVDRFYGGYPRAKIPSDYQLGRVFLFEGNRQKAFRLLIKAMLRNPLHLERWKFLLMSFLDQRLLNALRKVKRVFTGA